MLNNLKAHDNTYEAINSASKAVLFGAAIKDQGGVNHINEQWQSYWIELFKNNGYQCLDVIRPSLWSNELVEWWYLQNTFLFVAPENKLLNSESLQSLIKPIYDLTHPRNFLEKIQAVEKTQAAKKISPLKKLRNKLRNKAE